MIDTFRSGQNLYMVKFRKNHENADIQFVRGCTIVKTRSNETNENSDKLKSEIVAMSSQQPMVVDSDSKTK